uniref:Uncharacterized protein n=1 Tax=Rousettus aegyptiacus TaxID=9407 RepID=A0A7J8FI38_ROUAE|nr:hypothetical protein HJG63_011884 [Rousettus aegyptiacus]
MPVKAQSREVSVIFLVFVHEESEVWRSEALAEGTQVEKGFVEQDFRSTGFCSKIHTVSMATCCLLCNRRHRTSGVGDQMALGPQSLLPALCRSGLLAPLTDPRRCQKETCKDVNLWQRERGSD